MTILICGGRDFADYNLFTAKLCNYQEAMSSIISGGASGADSLAERYAANWATPIRVIKPDWKKDGKAAGFIRNQKMIDMKPDAVIAFWDGKSRGTADTINRAKKAKITTLIVYY